MKRIVYVVKIGLGIVMVLVAAYSLSSFEGFLDLILGAALMLSGIAFGVFLEKRHIRLFFFLSSLSFIITLSLYFFPILSHFQYLTGGLLIYFACAMVFNRKRAVIS